MKKEKEIETRIGKLNLRSKKILIEDPKEIVQYILGAGIIEFSVLDGNAGRMEPYTADEEIYMEFDNGKEMRIYINYEGKLCVYTD